tara:strand:- start:267 stop:443 length:177 start_codon:yes stop_codon:yes gene_type:complete
MIMPILFLLIGIVLFPAGLWGIHSAESVMEHWQFVALAIYGLTMMLLGVGLVLREMER